jgi:hypothetical protein
MASGDACVYGALLALALGVLLYQWRAGLITRAHWRQSFDEHGGWPGVALSLALVVFVLATGIVGLLFIGFVWGLAGVLRWLFMR